MFKLVPQAQAQTKEWETFNLGGGREYGCVYEHEGDQVATLRGLECMIANILMVTITIIGLVGFAMMIYAGFKYQLSGGDSKGTQDAKGAMTYAVIGLVVALSSFFILNILAQFTGINLITQFVIPQINQ